MRCACRACGRSCRPAGSSRSTGSTASACSPTRPPTSRSATGSPRRCSPPGGSRSAATASSTAIRIFPSKFVGGVVDLYHGLMKGNDDLVVHAYETWGFKRLSRDLIDVLNIWARFIYGPLLDARVRTIADGVKPSEYGRREAF